MVYRLYKGSGDRPQDQAYQLCFQQRARLFHSLVAHGRDWAPRAVVNDPGLTPTAPLHPGRQQRLYTGCVRHRDDGTLSAQACHAVGKGKTRTSGAWTGT